MCTLIKDRAVLCGLDFYFYLQLFFFVWNFSDKYFPIYNPLTSYGKCL